MKFFALLLMACATLFASKGKILNPITDVCWDCLFPITVSGVNVTPAHKDFKEHFKRFCVCGGIPPKVGIPLTFWEPLYLVDVTRHPYSLVSLGGISLGKETVKNRGSVGIIGDGPSQSSFYHVHVYRFPLIKLLGLFDDFLCLEDGKFDSLYLSELDPTWNDERLALILDPEAALFSNPAAQLACIGDCVSGSRQKPNDKLFWCAGCQGSLYPFTGTVAHHVGSLQATSLLLHRTLAMMHRKRMLKGYDEGEYCEAKYMPIIKKSLYKTQLVFPVPQTTGPCNALGRSDLLWSLKRPVPTQDESFSYLVWVKKQCCLDAVKPALQTTTGGLK